MGHAHVHTHAHTPTLTQAHSADTVTSTHVRTQHPHRKTHTHTYTLCTSFRTSLTPHTVGPRWTRLNPIQPHSLHCTPNRMRAITVKSTSILRYHGPPPGALRWLSWQRAVKYTVNEVNRQLNDQTTEVITTMAKGQSTPKHRITTELSLTDQLSTDYQTLHSHATHLRICLLIPQSKFRIR